MDITQLEYKRDCLRRHRQVLIEKLAKVADEIGVIDSQLLEADLNRSDEQAIACARASDASLYTGQCHGG